MDAAAFANHVERQQQARPAQYVKHLAIRYGVQPSLFMSARAVRDSCTAVAPVSELPGTSSFVWVVRPEKSERAYASNI